VYSKEFSCSVPSNIARKAAEYQERGRNTDRPSEIREFKNLERTFTEMADNEEWVEQQYDKLVHPQADQADAGVAAQRHSRRSI
jgi:hypothetical protein